MIMARKAKIEKKMRIHKKQKQNNKNNEKKQQRNLHLSKQQVSFHPFFKRRYGGGSAHRKLANDSKAEVHQSRTLYQQQVYLVYHQPGCICS